MPPKSATAHDCLLSGYYPGNLEPYPQPTVFPKINVDLNLFIPILSSLGSVLKGLSERYFLPWAIQSPSSCVLVWKQGRFCDSKYRSVFLQTASLRHQNQGHRTWISLARSLGSLKGCNTPSGNEAFFIFGHSFVWQGLQWFDVGLWGCTRGKARSGKGFSPSQPWRMDRGDIIARLVPPRLETRTILGDLRSVI